MKTIVGLIKLLIFLAIIALPLYLFHGFLLNKAATYLYYKDELKPADVIVVVPDNEAGYSVEYAAKLFKEGWSKKNRLILSGGSAIWKYTWASLMEEQALSLGVPRNAIVLEDKSDSTKENALFTKEILKKHGYTSLILVSSPYHSRRSNEVFKKIMGNEIRVISAPSGEGIRFVNWWKKEGDRETVLLEYLKLFWFWIFGI